MGSHMSREELQFIGHPGVWAMDGPGARVGMSP